MKAGHRNISKRMRVPVGGGAREWSDVACIACTDPAQPEVRWWWWWWWRADARRATANGKGANHARDVVPGGSLPTDQRRIPCHKPGQRTSAHCAIFGPTAWQYEAFIFCVAVRSVVAWILPCGGLGVGSTTLQSKDNARCTAQLIDTIDTGSVHQSRARSRVASNTATQCTKWFTRARRPARTSRPILETRLSVRSGPSFQKERDLRIYCTCTDSHGKRDAAMSHL
jgi:hypothetical protein